MTGETHRPDGPPPREFLAGETSRLVSCVTRVRLRDGVNGTTDIRFPAQLEAGRN
ncbi:MAG TPA: hypothetical protein H9881_05080 [Candidatus Stackebrandtia excrementipullorum]|nr:hypothetical protein [Candidatus Stackebrandtia excrementipullorum]